MLFDQPTTVSSIDGRYHATSVELSDYFSEYALIRARALVECEYLILLSETDGVGIRKLTDDEKSTLRTLAKLSLEDAQKVKEIEKETNHDVKAVEYYIKQRLVGTSMKDISEWVHFGLTSEDINSLAYGVLLRDALQKV